MAEKIGISRVVVPTGAGVGSAIGFLRAPVGYEVVRSLYQRFASLDIGAVNALLAEMQAEAHAVVARGSFGAAVHERRLAYMRYVGQGHEIAVALPVWPLRTDDIAAIRSAYDAEYARLYDRPVPGSDVEVLSYAITVSTIPDLHDAPSGTLPPSRPQKLGSRSVRDTATGELVPWALFERDALRPGAMLQGPAIVAEAETSTLVGPGWVARIDAAGRIDMTREAAP